MASDSGQSPESATTHPSISYTHLSLGLQGMIYLPKPQKINHVDCQVLCHPAVNVASAVSKHIGAWTGIYADFFLL